MTTLKKKEEVQKSIKPEVEVKPHIPSTPRPTRKRITFPTFDEVPKVRGIFRNIEYPNTGFSFSFRGGWKGPVKNYTLFDGQEYEIPKEVADHLNNRCAYKNMKWVSSDGMETVNAKPLTTSSMPNFKPEINKKTHRFMFQITGTA